MSVPDSERWNPWLMSCNFEVLEFCDIELLVSDQYCDSSPLEHHLTITKADNVHASDDILAESQTYDFAHAFFVMVAVIEHG